MAKITKKGVVAKEAKVAKPKVVAKEKTKADELEFHLGRLEGNSVSKQEVRAIFQSLFRA